MEKHIIIPDLGGAEGVTVIELLVQPGQTITPEMPLLTLEGDKATMEVPAPFGGTIDTIQCNVGDTVSEGDVCMTVVVAEDEATATQPASASHASPAKTTTQVQTITIPDIGGADGVAVIEVLVQVGDAIVAEQPLITLEGDKATMEVPSPYAGQVTSVALNVGDTVKEGDVVLTLACTTVVSSTSQATTAPPASATPATQQSQTITIPDIGGADGVAVIEVLVQVGDTLVAEQPLITLEGDKATMEVPSPYAGQVTSVALNVGDTVKEGDVVLTLATTDAVATAQPATPSASVTTSAPSPQTTATSTNIMAETVSVLQNASTGPVYAGPVVRRYANVYGVDLTRVRGTGAKGRITKEDVTQAIRAMVHAVQTGAVNTDAATSSQAKPAPMKEIDFSRFGPVTTQPMSKIKQHTGTFLSRNWQTIPHVTQQDSADITALEAYRKSLNSDLKAHGIKLSPLVFMMKAVAACLQQHPTFNASLSADGQSLIIKKYCHLGVAVETPNGLMVPVIRDVDQKDLITLSQEVVAVAERARTKGLAPKDMQGGCFTISSLGGIGGQHFTPIVNAPEVAILGVSRARQHPTWDGKSWVPILQVPLSLSYDHRVIDGADGARFITDLVAMLADMSADIFQVQTPIHSTEE